MKREPLLNEKLLSKCKSEYEDKIGQKKELIKSQSPEVKRWDMVYAFLFDAQLRYVIYRYSTGDKINELEPLIKEATENYIIYRNHPTAKNTAMKDSFFVYDECISILALNILIKSDGELMGRLAQTYDLLGKDMLIDKLFSYSLPARKISNKLAWPKPYEKLYAVFNKGAEDQVQIIGEYLKDWYKGMRKASWYGTDKNKENECAFYGYWSFESAAVTCLLKIDDSSFRDKLFYPKDFADFNRE